MWIFFSFYKDTVNVIKLLHFCVVSETTELIAITSQWKVIKHTFVLYSPRSSYKTVKIKRWGRKEGTLA